MNIQTLAVCGQKVRILLSGEEEWFCFGYFYYVEWDQNHQNVVKIR